MNEVIVGRGLFLLSIGCAIIWKNLIKIMLTLFKPIIQTLAGISRWFIVFFGLMVLVSVSRDFGCSGFTIIVASMVLAIMVLPTIIGLFQDAINSMPSEYVESSPYLNG